MTLNVFIYVCVGFIFTTLLILLYIYFIKKNNNLGIVIKTIKIPAPK